MDLDIRALRMFVAVAEDRHFTRAAHRLGMSQPALSRAIRRLEDRHHVTLLDRGTHHVELTEAGEVLLTRARDLLDRAEEAIHETQRTTAGLAGPVRLGFVIGAAGTVLPDIVRTFRTRHPRVELDLSHTSVAHGIRALQERRLDVALVRMPSPAAAADLVIDTLIPDPLVAAIPAPGDADNQPVSTSPLRLAELLNRPFVFWPRAMAPSLHDHIFQHCRTVTGQAPSVIIETSNTLALLALVAADVGVTLVTNGTAESLTRQAVAYRHLDDPPQATLAVVHHANPTPATRALIAVCHEFAARRRRDQKSIDLDTDR